MLVVVPDLGVVQVDQQLPFVVSDRLGVVDRALVQRLGLAPAQLAVRVQGRVLAGRLVRPVGVHVVVPQEHRLVVGPRVEPRQRPVVDLVGARVVAVPQLVDGALRERDEFVLAEVEVVVEGVEPPVEAVRPRDERVRVKPRGRVPRLRQRRRHGVRREPVVVTDRGVRVLPGQQRRHRFPRVRARAVRVREPEALGRELVEHRRGVAAVAVTPEVVRAERVGGQ